jgi:hypothetical protein
VVGHQFEHNNLLASGPRSSNEGVVQSQCVNIGTLIHIHKYLIMLDFGSYKVLNPPGTGSRRVTKQDMLKYGNTDISSTFGVRD